MSLSSVNEFIPTTEHLSAPRRSERFVLIETDQGDARAEFARDVEAGLLANPKRLPCRYFYDHTGSLLFEKICALPEYYLTRCEREILAARADEIAARFGDATTLVELGSGSSVKTRILIEAFLRRFRNTHYVPIDVSKRMLEQTSRALLERYPKLAITAFAGDYTHGLRFVDLEVDGPKCILWLGSSIGNLARSDAGDFLKHVRHHLGEGDGLLVGIDLRKDRHTLEQAYDDPRGVTAQFNRNLLVRINHEFGADFEPAKFNHRADYDEQAGRVEMHLVSTEPHDVYVKDLDLTVAFKVSETIHTENCHKYSLTEIERLAEVSKLSLDRQWFDTKRRFSINLLAMA